MSAGAEEDLSQFLKFMPSWGDFPPTFHVPTNILNNPHHATVIPKAPKIHQKHYNSEKIRDMENFLSFWVQEMMNRNDSTHIIH